MDYQFFEQAPGVSFLDDEQQVPEELREILELEEANDEANII